MSGRLPELILISDTKHTKVLLVLAILWFVVACSDPSATPTLSPTPSATPTFSPTPSTTPTLSPTPSATPTLSPTPSATPTLSPTPPTATATFSPPEHMAYVWWSWGPLDRTGFRELVIDFTIHNDPAPFPSHNARNGLYLMLGWGKLAKMSFYFGIQSNVTAGAPPYQKLGKAVIFSRWGTRDLALARWDEVEGFAQSSGHEGDFIGVRRLYAWEPGSYQIRLAPQETTPEGEWFGLWITNLASDTTTWIGSLMFPLGSQIIGSGYSTMEVYGSPIHIVDIPYWHVSIKRPKADGVTASEGTFGYSMFTGEVSNADIRYSQDDDAVHIRAGGETERIGAPGTVTFK